MESAELSMATLARAVGQRVRRLRRDRPPPNTLTWLAGRVGMSCSFLSMIENGRRLPSLGVLMALSEVLETSPGALLGGDPPSGQLLEPLATLFRRRRLGPREAQTLLRVARTMFR